MKRLEEIADSNDFECSPRIINDVMTSLVQANYTIPKLFDTFLKYIYKNRELISGNLIGKCLHGLYHLGYEESYAEEHLLPLPANKATTAVATNNLPCLESEVNFNDFNEIIHRDFEFMSGLSIVHACLALSFYRGLSISLINRIFNIDFIMRLEEEIKLSYSKVCIMFVFLFHLKNLY